MDWLILGGALAACLMHLLIFCMESLWFMRPAIYQRFGASTQAQAEAQRLFALNQGFYNLFLALGTLCGLLLAFGLGSTLAGYSLIGFGCSCMLAASLVLFFSAPQMWQAALMQGLPPAIALLGLLAAALSP